MTERPVRPAVRNALLLFPLVAVLAGLSIYAVRSSRLPQHDGLGTPPPSPGSAPARFLPGFPPPVADLPPERFFERVDGAADYLSAQGCTRLLAWRLPDLSSELEVLVFDRDEGAGRVLARDAGPRRTAGPGDESVADANGVLFRRGRFYVRMIPDPDGGIDPGRLLEAARRVDAALPARGGDAS